MAIDIEIAAWSSDDVRKGAVHAALEAFVTDLVATHDYDLSRLEAITVTADLDRALAEFDDGGLEAGRTLTRTRGSSEGFGMTPVCVRDGSARCHTFLAPAAIANLVADSAQSADAHDVARYIIAHELGHAHDLAQRACYLERFIIKSPGDLLTPPVFWQLAEICWNEYAACHLSCGIYPSILSAFTEQLFMTLRDFKQSVRAMIISCKLQGTSARAFAGAIDSLYPVLKHTSYVLGHLDGLKRSAMPPQISTALSNAGLAELSAGLGGVLREMWRTYPAWTEITVYDPLISFLKRAFRFAAVDVYEADGQLKAKLIMNLLPVFLGKDNDT